MGCTRVDLFHSLGPMRGDPLRRGALEELALLLVAHRAALVFGAGHTLERLQGVFSGRAHPTLSQRSSNNKKQKQLGGNMKARKATVQLVTENDQQKLEVEVFD